ncbi:MAG: hypothetical protein IPJ65_14385 [Archangiaceae bacterium]|nr:hypothetical protein [Archangiaceae bacterium]
MRPWITPLLCLACGVAGAPRPGASGGEGVAGGAGGGAPSAYEAPVVKNDHSLFWNDWRTGLFDAPPVVSFAQLMAAASADRHGGRLLERWFNRFATTAHSERALPAQFIEQIAAAQGADPSRWSLSALPFKLTAVHNRIDLAELKPGGHCGELRASATSSDVTLQPFHALFIFRQPAEAGDVAADGTVTCVATARRWAGLSRLDGDDLQAAVRAEIQRGVTAARFELVETVEFTLSPWEWRQWVKVPDPMGALPYVLDNPPLFQQVDVEGLNRPGARRDDFLRWVAANAEALDARRLLIPEAFRAPSVRVLQGVPRVPLSLEGLDPAALARFPRLRQELELVGCAACHTADAEFVHTRPDRTVSEFYRKELLARERFLEQLASGGAAPPPYGPLQGEPVLPP